MSGGDLERDLERLRAATETITPGEGLGDAVIRAVKGAATSEDPLASIARRTSGLDAAPEITDAIFGRIRPLRGAVRPAPTPSWAEGVGRAGPFAVGIALLAAAASFVLFLSSQREVDATIVSSVDTVEVIE